MNSKYINYILGFKIKNCQDRFKQNITNYCNLRQLTTIKFATNLRKN